MRFCTPLRYPGGKGKLANFMKLIFEENSLCDAHYIEPYAGGAGIAFELLFEEYTTHIHINDLNKLVYAFWSCVLKDTDALIKLISDTPVVMDEWYRQKGVQKEAENHSTLELGFSTFFLNRTNRSGIINGGVIGGKNQTGKWKLDARYNKKDLISRIAKIAKYSSRISLYNYDAGDFITGVLPNLPLKALVYLDPPYYVKGGSLYKNQYTHKDHVAISKLVKGRIKQPWIVSYDNTSQVLPLYANIYHIVYRLNYSAQNRYHGSELMFFCKKLIVPNVPNPAKVKAA